MGWTADRGFGKKRNFLFCFWRPSEKRMEAKRQEREENSCRGVQGAIVGPASPACSRGLFGGEDAVRTGPEWRQCLNGGSA